MRIQLLTIVFSVLACTVSSAGFINEFHYDNTGGDTNEFVEIILEPGEDIADFSVQLYNGSDGGVYGTISSSDFTLGSSSNGLSVYTSLGSIIPSIQNGTPDGLALIESGMVDISGGVAQFLSYEGSFTATDGVANGLTSTDIGVSEPPSAVGESLQLSGVGLNYSDFVWNSPAPNTSGAFNTNQAAAPEPSSLVLVCAAGLGAIAWRRRGQRKSNAHV